MKPVMQKCIAALSSVVCLGAALTLPASAAVSNQSDAQLETYAMQVLILLNEIRAENGLTPFYALDSLESAAAVRAEECLTSFSHFRPDGSPCFSVLETYQVPYMAAGENIAYGQTSPQQVVDSWMASELHRENILNPAYSYAGVGVAKDTQYAWSNLFVGGVTISGATAIVSQGMIGDVNFDGSVTGQDAYLALMAYAHQESGLDISLTDDQKAACDVNENGVIDMTDAYGILLYYSHQAAGDGRSWSEILEIVG